MSVEFRSFFKTPKPPRERKVYQIPKIGKIGKRNEDANKAIWEYFKVKKIVSCEVKLSDKCWGSERNSPHHRHVRHWYRNSNRQVLLSDVRQVIRVCPFCHDVLQQDMKLSEEYFMKLRGKE